MWISDDSVSLLHAGKMEERLGQVVPVRPLAAGNLLPGALVVRKIVAEPELTGTDRVEYPAGAPLDVGRDQRSAPLTRRTAWATAGSGSSRLKTASTYGGRRNAGCEPLIRLIAQRFPAPFIRTAVCGRPRRSR